MSDPGRLSQRGLQLRAGALGVDDLNSHDTRLARLPKVEGDQGAGDFQTGGDLLLRQVIVVIQAGDLNQPSLDRLIL